MAMNAENEIEEVVNSTKRKSRAALILSIVVLICSLGIAGFLIIKYYSQQNQTETSLADALCESGAVLEELDTETSLAEIDEKAKKIEDEQNTITLCMVGDILTHDRVFGSAKRSDDTYDYNAIFSKTCDFLSARDLALVNQEVIIGGTELGVSGYPCFNAPYELADALVAAGFDIVCHGTNHALDRHGEGVKNCLSNWQKKYPEIEVLGIHDSKEDQEHLSILEIKGHKIAFLNYTYGTNGIPLPADMPYAVDYLNEERVVADIKRAEKEAEFTVVLPHWGSEYLLSTDYSQQQWTKLFLENGVDLVIGTHSHVIEPVEVVEDDNGHKMLVYYSLGNFVNWSAREGAGVANQMVGGIADVTLKQDDEKKLYISDYSFVPVVTDLHYGQDGVVVYLLQDYTEEQAKTNEAIKQDYNFSLDYCIDLVKRVCGANWVAGY